MQGIPIVVSRLTGSGRKQVHTVRDLLDGDPNSTLFYKPTPQFSTMDHCKDLDRNRQRERDKDHKVRIRRIQSSGSRRKFPRDFFSRDGQRPSRNATLKQNTITEYLQQETATFATINQCLHNPPQKQQQIQAQILETPKFKQKINTQRISALYKNQTLKQSIKKFVAKKNTQRQKREHVHYESGQNCQEYLLAKKSPSMNHTQNKNTTKQKQKQTILVNSFENTFSGNQFRTLNQQRKQCDQLDLRAILRPDKENYLPIKRMKASKQNFIKKFSTMKDKPPFLRPKNPKQ